MRARLKSVKQGRGMEKNCQNVCQVHRKTMEKQCYAQLHCVNGLKMCLSWARRACWNLFRVQTQKPTATASVYSRKVGLDMMEWHITKKTTDMAGTTTDERSDESQLYRCESEIFAHSMTPLNHHNQAVNSELTDLFLKSESARVKFSPQECCWVLPLV